MREDFLHFLWRQARFNLRNLKTTTGATISIQDFGRHNKDAGPDFLHGQLRLNGQQWAGNIELHVKSSDWYAHKHENDRAYDNVILHVVYEEDKPVFRPNGERIPCLELRGRVPSGLLSTYWRMQNNEYWVSCQHQLHQIEQPSRQAWLIQLIQQRMQKRTKRFSERMTHNHRDWEEAYYQSLARALGGRVNADAMDMLARSLPLRILLKHKHSLLQLEALLFGQSGLLPKVKKGEDDYISLLRREYALLRLKHNLRPIPATAWRYLRLRPNNFPTIRIAQLAAMLHRTGQLFGKSLAAADARELKNMFVVKLSNYWREHYRFGKRGKAGERRLGATTIRSILINTIVPALIAYGGQRGDIRFRERAFALLRELPAERNVVLEKWAELGMKATNAAESQALLELKISYCEQRRCTECAIGCQLLIKPYDKEGDEPLLTLNEQAQVYGLMGVRS